MVFRHNLDDCLNLRVHRCPGRAVLDSGVRVRQFVMRRSQRQIKRVSGAAAASPIEVTQHLFDKQAERQRRTHHDLGLERDDPLCLEPVGQRLRMHGPRHDGGQVHARHRLTIGIVAAQSGTLEVKADKLTAAMENLSAVRNLFTSEDGDATTVGFGLKVKAFADGIAGTAGTLNARTDSLKQAVTRNGKEQERVNDRAARAEVRYLAQYNAMDAAVGRLSSLGAFVNQQVTMWNKSSG